MPNGFVGNAARRYLGDVNAAHTRAVSAGRDVPENMTQVREARMPFMPEDANLGRASVGRGSSDNIVVSIADYNDVAHAICRIEDTIGQCMYRTTVEIEEMCRTIFVMPTVSPGCINIASEVKSCLGPMRSIPDDAAILVRNFAREIDEIGG